jgi:hypothetical protein
MACLSISMLSPLTLANGFKPLPNAASIGKARRVCFMLN